MPPEFYVGGYFLSATAPSAKTRFFFAGISNLAKSIHFDRGGKVGCQEYSELSNSSLLILSAPAICRNRQLGIFRNSEYRKFKYEGALSLRRGFLRTPIFRLLKI
jgi:hypothetical protein